MAMTIPVYYYVFVEDGATNIVVVGKDYFDKEHCIDDGDEEVYHRISVAMAMCGAFETCEGTFEACPDKVDNIIAKMRTLGFDMQENREVKGTAD